jgi:hypothetical protein
VDFLLLGRYLATKLLMGTTPPSTEDKDLEVSGDDYVF